MTAFSRIACFERGAAAPDGGFWSAECDGARIRVARNGAEAGCARRDEKGALVALDADDRIAALAAALERLFVEDRDRRAISLAPDLIAAGEARALGCVEARLDGWLVRRAGFFQSAPLWLAHAPARHLDAAPAPGPEGRDHPRRAPEPEGLRYQRFDPDAGVHVGFRALDPERDLDRFHRWMNDGRVAWFWELALPKAELAAYIAARRADPHTHPLILCFDGEAAGYVETYWVREDRLGPYYDSAPWDRGWHALIGERAHLGREKTAAWLRALGHFLFLDCPMTEKLMGEPRADNAKLLRYAARMSYEKVREFDFPHKRAALMRLPRERFFAEQV